MYLCIIHEETTSRGQQCPDLRIWDTTLCPNPKKSIFKNDSIDWVKRRLLNISRCFCLFQPETATLQQVKWCCSLSAFIILTSWTFGILVSSLQSPSTHTLCLLLLCSVLTFRRGNSWAPAELLWIDASLPPLHDHSSWCSTNRTAEKTLVFKKHVQASASREDFTCYILRWTWLSSWSGRFKCCFTLKNINELFSINLENKQKTCLWKCETLCETSELFECNLIQFHLSIK